MIIINFLKKLYHLPFHIYTYIYQTVLLFTQPYRYRKAICKLKEKDKIKVAFFAIHSSVWKYDYLYQLMEKHPKFEPIIVICPVVNMGWNNMLIEMQKCYELFSSKGYNVVRAYDAESKKYLNVKKEISPDIIFYTNPYKGLIDNRYYITKFLNTLTCYVPYSASICSNYEQYCIFLHYLVWRFYAENKLSYNLASHLMPTKGRNVVTVGYPVFDNVLQSSYKPKNVWKHKQKYKIIWAPHHTILKQEMIYFSKFFEFADSMLSLAKEYKDTVQFAFKPHPLLYAKLVMCWGQEKTDKYYQEWSSMSNTQYEDGDYIDLFMASDAMIFDSVSFVHEYLFTKKRSLFIYSNSIDSQLNEFGKAALKCHQKGQNMNDVRSFITSLLSGEVDPLAEEKKQYFNDYIIPTGADTASESILQDILKAIN